MTGAPILIPTLNRDVHFIRLVESLKKNTWAKYTPVYIALDYPPSTKYMDGYNKICKYLESDFSMFKEFNIFRRKENYGSVRNMLEMREEVLKKYDRFIRTDDDAEFSPNFLEYMNLCLEKYKDNPDVIAVTGYSYPIEWRRSKGATILKENFSCPMWGTGFWRDKYKVICDYISKEKGLGRDASLIIKSGTINKMLDVAKYEFVNLCLSPDFEETLAAKISDVALRMYAATQGKYIIIPTISKVRNWGFDGTGEYCPKISIASSKVVAGNYDYAVQAIDSSGHFILREDTLEDNEWNRDLMNEFDPLSPKAKLKMKGKLALFYIMGEKVFHKIMQSIRP